MFIGHLLMFYAQHWDESFTLTTHLILTITILRRYNQNPTLRAEKAEALSGYMPKDTSLKSVRAARMLRT